jgi:hypothetical protein
MGNEPPVNDFSLQKLLRPYEWLGLISAAGYMAFESGLFEALGLFPEGVEQPSPQTLWSRLLIVLLLGLSAAA